MTDLLFKASGSCFHQGILVFCFFYSVTPPTIAICLFSKSRTSRCASCLCVVFRWALQPRPSVTQAFAALLLADCCLQPSPVVWYNVKYSLLNCQARTGWEPSQAFTVQSHWMPPPSTAIQPNQSLFLQPIQNQTSLLPSSCHTPTSFSFPLLLLYLYLK